MCPTRVLSDGRSLGESLESTRTWAARRSGETPANWTESTVDTLRNAVATDWAVERSDPLSVPCEATKTTWIRVWSAGPTNGSARCAAWLLGASAGRNALLLLLTSLPRLGSPRTAAPVPTSQSTRMTQR